MTDKKTRSKERDYSFDAIRGFCMFLVVFQHFMTAQEGFLYAELEGYAYFVGDLFVMQMLFFLSGYFSKKPERGREIAFKALLWPLLVCCVGFFMLKVLFGIAGWGPSYSPPYALWFLLCLFYYRFFHKNYIKIPHIFGIVFLLGLFVGAIPFLTKDFALSRTISWMPYFLLGYYCRPEHMEKIRSLKFWQTGLLLIVLLMGTWLFMRYASFNNYPAVTMQDTNAHQGITQMENVFIHLIVLPVSSGFGVVLFNLFGNKKGMWSFLGQNTMPIYLFHLFGKFAILHLGLGFGLFTPPAHNTPLYLLYLAGVSLIACLALATRPSRWLYDLIFVKSYDWCRAFVLYVVAPLGGVVEKGLLACVPWLRK